MAEKSGTNKPKQDTEAENEDAKGIKELLSVASHERKNLQLLVEYFETSFQNLMKDGCVCILETQNFVIIHSILLQLKF